VLYTIYQRPKRVSDLHGIPYRKSLKEYSNIYPTRCNITRFILSGNCSTRFGWWYHHPKHVEQFQDKINRVTLHLVGYILEYSYDARPHERSVPYKNLYIKPELCENRISDGHIQLMSIYGFLPMCPTPWTLWVKFGAENIHVMSSSNCKRRKNRWSETHIGWKT
jgi:hypothetical protein